MTSWTRSLVARVGGADEEVVGDVDARHQRLEALGVAVGQLLRRDALALGRLRDRLAVLVGAGEEEDLLAALAHVAGEDVGADRRVRVPEVRRRVDVVDRRGDVEGHRRGLHVRYSEAWNASTCWPPRPEYDDADPEGYRAGMDRFGPKIGASQIGGSVYEIPPGQSICPYHYEYPEEEWLMPLDGVVIVRTPEGEAELGLVRGGGLPAGRGGRAQGDQPRRRRPCGC